MLEMPAAEADGPQRQSAPRSLRDVAYEAIKLRITTCAFKPGEYINEAYLSASLGIGRTPVHQALDRLMTDGLVEVIPRKGVIVKPISLDEIIKIIEVRLVNEVYCVRLAAERAAADELSHLSDVLARTREWMAARNNERMMLLDREFHMVIARASKNDVLGDFLGKLHDRSLRFWFISLDRPGHHESVFKDHHAILEALRDRDPDRAEQAMRAHIENFRRNTMKDI